MGVEIKGVDQFASNQGFRDLMAASAKSKILSDFFEATESKDVPAIVSELRKLAKTARADVASTASGLAEMIEGRKSIQITDGAGNFEFIRAARRDVRKSLKKPTRAAPKKKPPAARKAKTKAAPKKDHVWFETKVAELKAEAEKLPHKRQAELRRKIGSQKEE